MKKFAFSLKCFFLFFCTIAFAACLATDASQQTIVLERSELGRPSWVSKTIENEPVHEKWFLYQKSDIVRLDLGIRQAQSSALAAHCQLIASRMRFEVDQVLRQLAEGGQKSDKTQSDGTAGGVLSPEARRAVDKVIQELAQSQTCPELELKDVYWEQLRKPSPDGPKTSYSVYVLLRLKQLPFDEVLAMTAESLKLSAQAEVRPLVDALRGRMSNSSERGTNE